MTWNKWEGKEGETLTCKKAMLCVCGGVLFRYKWEDKCDPGSSKRCERGRSNPQSQYVTIWQVGNETQKSTFLTNRTLNTVRESIQTFNRTWKFSHFSLCWQPFTSDWAHDEAVFFTGILLSEHGFDHKARLGRVPQVSLFFPQDPQHFPGLYC